MIVYPDQHNHQGINNSIRAENHRIRIDVKDRNIALRIQLDRSSRLDRRLTVDIA